VDIAALVRALHVTGEPTVGDGVQMLGERVDFIFEHWIGRYQQRSDLTDVVPIAALRRGHQLARRLTASSEQIVLVHGDLHPGNVLNAGKPRGLVAIDPRPCIGDPAFDLVDWVFWNAEGSEWNARSHELSSLLGVEPERLWAWCSAFAAILAAGSIRRGGNREQVDALMNLAA
jgi:streptomycin 6-kinase